VIIIIISGGGKFVGHELYAFWGICHKLYI